MVLLLNALMQINEIRLVGEFYEFDIYKISREFCQMNFIKSKRLGLIKIILKKII